MDTRKSYYAVIPAAVRYDNRIIPHAKLLYGEITALCNEKGYCWATNDYFSNLYSVSKRTISSWIKSLCDAGYITSDFVFENDSKKVKVRCLKVEANFYTRRMKTSIPSRSKLHDPHEENFAENNTLNNTINNSSSQLSETEKNQETEKQKVDDKMINTNKKFESDDEPYKLALYLEDCIRFNEPKFPHSEQRRQCWTKDIDRMLRIDKIDPDEVAAVIAWSQKDPFWRSNILSGKKLREKYPQLLMKMNQRQR